MRDLRLRKYAPGGRMAPHYHDESSFTIVLEGCYRERIFGRTAEHRPGSMLFYPAGEVHSQEFGNAGSLKLIFQPSEMCLDLLRTEKVPLAQSPSVRSTLIEALARRTARELKSPDAFSAMVSEGTLLELISAFGRSCRVGRMGKNPPHWLRQCRERLEAEPLTRETHATLAAHARKHPVHLAKAFREAYGETIGEFQRRSRLKHAEALVRKTMMPLAGVALECGFANQAHFSRSFKNAFGASPASYRTYNR